MNTKRIKNNATKRISGFLLFLGVACSMFAQSYWQEKVDLVTETGYHHIEVSPEITGLGFRTLLITDEDNNEIPYFVRTSISVGKNKTSEQFTEINLGNFNVKEDKKSHSTILSFPDAYNPYYLSKIQLYIKNKEHYKRNAQITNDDVTLAHFSLTSRKESSFLFNNILIDKGFSIVIENENNLPLQIDSIKLFTFNCYLCAYLEAGKNYRIKTNGEAYKHYDIHGFTDEIASFLPIVKTSDLIYVSVPVMLHLDPEPKEKSFFEKPLFLWTVIALTGILLIGVCVRMLNEMRKK
ncbi:hypothetical protein [Bacteroides sp. 519]|uniref:hypothetical protein n=1 Tax=Bacteroides sp. 519 TaxID=2302937 RepID=UPI0013D39170|nr:hypothetical protein [Bacteroides sp. 519]